MTEFDKSASATHAKAAFALVSRIGLLLLVVFSLSRIAIAADVKDVSGYRLIDSGYIGNFPAATNVPMGWIDGNRLLFIGARPGEFSDDVRAVAPGGARTPRFALYLWDMRDGRVRLHHQGHNSSLLCVADDWIHYRYGLKEVPGGYMSEVILEGSFGKELARRDTEQDAQERREHNLLLNPYTCREYARSSLPKLEGRVWPLLEGEFISLASRDESRGLGTLKYWPKNRQAALLSLSDEPVGVSQYSRYLDSYVLDESPRNFVFGDKIFRRMWAMNRSGEAKEVVLPAGPWMRGSVSAMPTRRGVFMASHAISAQGPGAAGGYLVNGTETVRIVPGFPHAYSVAPDGCKVALSLGPAEYQGARPYPQIKVVDICSEGK